ncbi:MAG: tRNA-dihydrouridine synthase [Patescibacteria group bacterium]|jgi:tRNA-dihydrouridine synthase B
MKNFWKELKHPIIVLAPLAGITDAAFRFLCGKNGADVVYSEMVSAAGLFYDSERTSGLLDRYKSNGGAKFVVQLFGNDPKHFAKAVKIVEKFKPDGIDINFGCPVPKVQKAGAGVKLFQDLELSHRVIEACIKNTKLPISVKTRIKAGNISVLDFIEKIKDLPITALMVHGRTLAQGFSGEVDYQLLNRAKKKFKGVFIANGGITNIESAQEMLKKTEADVIAIGQAACGKPWIFKEIKKHFVILNGAKRSEESILDRQASLRSTGTQDDKKKNGVLQIALKHAKLMHKLKGEAGIREMRKHLCWYAKGLSGAAELRKEFVKVETLKDIKKLLK